MAVSKAVIEAFPAKCADKPAFSGFPHESIGLGQIDQLKLPFTGIGATGEGTHSGIRAEILLAWATGLFQQFPKGRGLGRLNLGWILGSDVSLGRFLKPRNWRFGRWGDGTDNCSIVPVVEEETRSNQSKSNGDSETPTFHLALIQAGTAQGERKSFPQAQRTTLPPSERIRAFPFAASASGMLPSRTYICDSAVQASRSFGWSVTA